MKEISRTAYRKIDGKWVETFKETEPEQVYKWLMHDLIAKKLHQAKYITRIKDRTNYDGTRTVEVHYTEGVKNIFIVEF